MEKQSLLPPEMSSVHVQESRRHPGIFQRATAAWLRFSGPDVQRFSASLEDQERLRRSRVLSALCFLSIIVALLMIPTAVPVPTYWISILLFVLLETLAFFFN